MAELCAWLGAPTAYIGLGAEEEEVIPNFGSSLGIKFDKHNTIHVLGIF